MESVFGPQRDRRTLEELLEAVRQVERLEPADALAATEQGAAGFSQRAIGVQSSRQKAPESVTRSASAVALSGVAQRGLVGNADDCAIVADGRTGWLVPPDDEDALVDALVTAASEPEERRARGERAHAESRSYAWPMVARRFAALFEELLVSRQESQTQAREG